MHNMESKLVELCDCLVFSEACSTAQQIQNHLIPDNRTVYLCCGAELFLKNILLSLSMLETHSYCPLPNLT